MSAEGPSLQAQVESLLSALVKTAAVELTRLFESRYSASAAAAAEVGRIAGQKEPGTAESRPAVNTKHSVGVQVDESVYPVQEPDDSTTFPDQLCNCKEEEKGDLIPIGLLLPEENGYIDSLKSSPSREMSDDSSDLDGLDSKEPNDGETGTEVVLQVFMDSPVRSSLEEQKPLVLLAGNPNVTVDENVAFVCPLILKPETPGPNLESWMAESHQAGVSTAGGTAYSPSPSDGAMTPVLASLPETTKLKPNVRLNMNLNTPDQKLLRPCGVKLVNILTIPDFYLKPQDNPNLGHPLPKELRRHQGVHTGHRLCCFDPCENGVWRLQSIVAHCRDGYTCSNCGKTFKRRKILRRHERFHTGEKPYQCVVCAKTFALKKSLRRHLRFHTGERPHSCTQCDKSFRLRETLKAHMGFHSGEKPFSCATCGKTFRIRRNLEKHQLSQCGFFVPSFKMIAGR